MRKTAEERKEQILTVALRLADELGPDRLTTGAVADAIGLTQPAIFRHFPTKQALWAALAIRTRQRMHSSWQAALGDQISSEARIAAVIDTQLSTIAENPALPAILFSRELQVENGDLRKTFAGAMAAFRNLLHDEVAKGRDAGVFRRDLDPSDAAALLLSLVQGLAIRWSLGAREFDVRQEGARLVQVQLRLFAASPQRRA
ncbi:Transcriptional regulator, TetR family [Pseudorhizobium banfieldiae]|uniref:Transcriptional regulator, TetR family n=1 Tax=Pseudorhizobium banfieldiae TaxID=1125847 RepID=L0NDI1_9HYPH|nr:TetR/AcrR family transcriptional regulator [Pseudorhizobium banfieldiae]CAD6602135.1 TetR/AcrR family transcriptional regulator [arsenite-oxidising bacterium NT-25]CAD6606568.1 TetR/AcrR family transcriptional regulator [Rhizobium sp. TCK]CCF18372.1 Transcriptional regulator, TetR family [Pseudorhizobium banfieldiae]